MQILITGREDELAVLIRHLESVGPRLDAIETNTETILRSLRHITQKENRTMALIDDLRQVQSDEGAALTTLLQSIADETAQVEADLANLVAAEGNAVTDADVQSARDHLAALQGLVSGVEAIDPNPPS